MTPQRRVSTLSESKKVVEVLQEYLAAMENACAVLAQGLKRLDPAPQKTGLSEESFNSLKWEPAKGERLGEFECAFKTSNQPDPWQRAFNVLKSSSATLKDHYSQEGFAYYYWLYLEKYSDRIFRKRKVK